MSTRTHLHAPQPHLYNDYTAFYQAHPASTPPDETLARWAHHHILVAISNHQQLTNMVIYKGGNALRSAHASVRATRDLDFSIEETLPEAPAQKWLDAAFRRQSQRADILLRVQSFNPKPKRADGTQRTWQISVGYALKSQARVLRRLNDDPPQSPYKIPLEISENEAVGAYDVNRIQGAEKLHVSTLENILAEKLRALLQQPLRNRYRPQDVFDIAYQCLRVKNQNASPLDLQSLHKQFEEKCRVRDVPSSLEGFLQEEVWTRAKRDYEKLKETIPASEHLAFAEARAEVEALLKALSDRTKQYYSG